jgi:hypothetical protein
MIILFLFFYALGSLARNPEERIEQENSLKKERFYNIVAIFDNAKLLLQLL